MFPVVASCLWKRSHPVINENFVFFHCLCPPFSDIFHVFPAPLWNTGRTFACERDPSRADRTRPASLIIPKQAPRVLQSLGLHPPNQKGPFSLERRESLRWMDNNLFQVFVLLPSEEHRLFFLPSSSVVSPLTVSVPLTGRQPFFKSGLTRSLKM